MWLVPKHPDFPLGANAKICDFSCLALQQFLRNCCVVGDFPVVLYRSFDSVPQYVLGKGDGT